MKYYITPNINNDEINFSQGSASLDSKEKYWIYRNPLLEHLKNIPNEIICMVPFNYFKENEFNQPSGLGDEIIHLSFSMEGASEVINRITSSLDQIKFSNAFDDLKYYITLVSSELVRNAVIENLKQSKIEKIDLMIKESENEIQVIITDLHGELKVTDLTGGLRRVAVDKDYERKEYGAGLGFFMIVSSVNSIEINVESRVKTRIICRINKCRRLKHFKEKETAIFFNNEKKYKEKNV